VLVYSIVFNLLVGERQWKGFSSIFSLQAFLRRHLEIVEKNSEPVTSATSCVSEADIRKCVMYRVSTMKRPNFIVFSGSKE
jgi:hypothetical protein